MKKQFKKALVILGSPASGKTKLAYHMQEMFTPNETVRLSAMEHSNRLIRRMATSKRVLIIDEIIDAERVKNLWTSIVATCSGIRCQIPAVIFICQDINPFDLPEENFDFVEIQNPYLTRQPNIQGEEVTNG